MYQLLIPDFVWFINYKGWDTTFGFPTFIISRSHAP